jgi:hypothetical protein
VIARLVLVMLVAGALAACAGPRPADSYVEAIQASGDLPESRLLDVGIGVFDPGLPERGERPRDLVFEGVREAEARYLPVQLRDTLQNTGHWGLVRVVPGSAVGLDLHVSGKILQSDSELLVLLITVRDATNRQWFSREYRTRADTQLYVESAGLRREPYQRIFNLVANDLLAFRDRLSDQAIAEIRRVAELRFAQDLSPDAFSGHLEQRRDGRFVVRRLPAHDDPMLERVRLIRERDFMFLDTLNEHYSGLHRDMASPYESWRRFTYEELIARREVERRAFWQKAAGVAAIAGAIVMDGNSQSADTARTVLIIGGAELLKAGFQTSREATIHANALIELGRSFSAEIRPVVVEVQGETRRLEGSAETQFQEWRELLRAIYGAETGFLEAVPELIEAPPALPETMPEPAGELPELPGADAAEDPAS